MKSESVQRLDAMVKLACAQLAISPDCFDRDPYRLNVANGTVDLRTGLLMPHSREDFQTKLAPVICDINAKCPAFDAFLQRVLGDSQPLVDFVHRVLGYVLTGDVSEQVMFFAYGPGANGKSTLLGVLQHMLGDYALQAPSSLLLARKHEPHPTEQAQLRGKRLAACIEVERGQRFHESLVKHLTGGDRITARGLYQDFFTFSPTHKLVLAANDKPIIRGTDEAIWRRVLTIPFTVTIPAAERDPQLREKLLDELPGILALAVRGCLKWQEYGLRPPPEVLAANAAYRREMDVLADFVAEECVETTGAQVPKGSLFDHYNTWCGRNHVESALGKHGFGRAIEARGHQAVLIGHKRVHAWRGIGLVTGCQALADNADMPSANSYGPASREVAGEKVRNVRNGYFSGAEVLEP